MLAESQVLDPLGTLGVNEFVASDAVGKPLAPGMATELVHYGFAPAGPENVAYAPPGVVAPSLLVMKSPRASELRRTPRAIEIFERRTRTGLKSTIEILSTIRDERTDCLFSQGMASRAPPHCRPRRYRSLRRPGVNSIPAWCASHHRWRTRSPPLRRV